MSDEQRPNDPEGVRIIGADEAEKALEREDVARRRGPDDPRPGDRPEPSKVDTPEPVLRFPLSSSANTPAVDPGESLPHWTAPPTGAVPAFDDEPTSAGDDWSSFTTSQPRWREDEAADDWDDADDMRGLGGGDAPLGALDESDRPDPDDFFTFDELAPEPPGRSVFAGDDEDDEFYDDDEDGTEYDEFPRSDPNTIVVGGGRVSPGPSRPRAPSSGIGGDRDMTQALGVGVGFLVVAAIAFFVGPAAAAVLVIAVVIAASIELLTALRGSGYRPAAPVAIAGTLGLLLGTFHRGESAIGIVLVLVVVASFLWFLIGAGEGQMVLNAGVTVLAVLWVGLMGSFATLLLSSWAFPGAGDTGKGILFGAILCTVGYDVGGYFVGRSAGRSPLSAASPNKTIEGLLGGMALAVVVGIVYGNFTQPMGSIGDGLLLGVAAAIAAPLGDLCQSAIKRDLGVKDMGQTLPGHGGFLDRFDALLFVLPAVYLVARLNDFFLG